MKLIVGLGNPGDKFQYTRHNVGFMVVERLVKDRLPLAPSLTAWKKKEKYVGEVCKLDDVVVVKPQTYMNLAGMCVARLASYYKILVFDIWVVHDDIDLPLGKIRIRKGGASAGHHGIDSIIRELGGKSDFVRFRLGIGRGKLDIKKTTDINLHRRAVKNFVVSPFRETEAGDAKKLIKRGAEALELALKKGIDVAMNRFN